MISLIIATVDRVPELKKLLLSLADADPHDVEVIVVDQNPDDRLKAVLDSVPSHMCLQWVRQRRRSASMARNQGALIARGTWLGFPDDDCAFFPDTLDSIRRAISSGRADVLTGMTRDADGQPSVLRWHSAETTITPKLLRSTFAESTLYLRRELFWSVHGFDELFGPGSRFAAEEGIDLIRRLTSAHPDIRMLYSPKICFYHRQRLTYADWQSIEKAQAYAHARGAMFARHWRSVSHARALNEVGKHLAGSLIFSGLRRRSRITALAGLCQGFIDYLLQKKAPLKG